MLYMTQTTVITTRTRREVKDILERAGINISAAIRIRARVENSVKGRD
jgi:antitoxin component of RelBE/YafQ-DinJ toxin-antitoxin module